MDSYQKSILNDAQESLLGYPCNMAYDYSALFSTFKYRFNNVGCPFEDSTYKVNTKKEERNVLKFFETLWGFDTDNVWGYVTTCGTEGNLQAMFIARQMYPNGIIYTSEDTHYSIPKIAKLLNAQLCIVKSRENGEMDYDDFEKCICRNLDKPVIVNANLGTTMLGATDNTREIHRILCKHNKQNEYYIHGDGALMGFVLPFIEKDIFFKKNLHSISISGHKFLGVPFPCGVFMMEQRLLDIVNTRIEYIASTDCTISGSRSGHSALFLDYIIKQKGVIGFESDILKCIENAEYMIHKMSAAYMPAWRNQNSITVVMDKPSPHVVDKWQLATQTRMVSKVEHQHELVHHHKIAHAIILPHVTKKKINRFVKEYKSHYKI